VTFWAVSSPMFVCREGPNGGNDSPWKSASIVAGLMSRQTKSGGGQRFSKTVPSGFDSIQSFFNFFMLTIRLPGGKDF
jgi:hypothetical protein